MQIYLDGRKMYHKLICCALCIGIIYWKNVRFFRYIWKSIQIYLDFMDGEISRLLVLNFVAMSDQKKKCAPKMTKLLVARIWSALDQSCLLLTTEYKLELVLTLSRCYWKYVFNHRLTERWIVSRYVNFLFFHKYFSNFQLSFYQS